MPRLTVRETLIFAAHFHLSEGREHVGRRVDETLTALGLIAVADTMTIGLDGDPRTFISGGERKRLSIGVEMFSRPTQRHRPEYFIADVRNPAGSFGPGYPTIMGGYEPGMEDAGWNPLHLIDPTIISPSDSQLFIVLHEYGHQHFFPTLPGETEVNVNLPATYIYHQKLKF